jgi:hypothetical protein
MEEKLKIFESKLEGGERSGRPSLRWLEDFEKDMRDIVVKWWRQNVVDREECSLMTKDVDHIWSNQSQLRQSLKLLVCCKRVIYEYVRLHDCLFNVHLLNESFRAACVKWCQEKE